MTQPTSPTPPPASPRTRWFRPTLSTWIGGALIAGLLLIAAISGGIVSLLVIAGVVGLITGLYVVVTGRRSWASVPTRSIGAIAMAGSLMLMVMGGTTGLVLSAVDSLSTASSGPIASPTPKLKPTPKPIPTPSPTARFTDEDPADPATTTAPAETASVVIIDTDATDTTALALLGTIEVKGKAPKTGYDRSGRFGSAWLDVDRNGCDTRNDILARDLTSIQKSGTCRVMTGNLTSPFTGTDVAFVRGNDTSALVQIDHVVALSNAWQTGAQQLTQAQRISFANDPLNLLAVDGRSNAQKGDGDTATWLPTNKPFRCGYVARQVSVKATYGLWITQAEHDAMARVLGSCASEPAHTSTFTPAPVPAPAPAPAPAPVPAPAAPVYANCDAVRAAGAAPIHPGDPGFEQKFDRDKDGVGCDT